ncbi:hypothetical protein [Bradyrhizobium elkanii]|uniref:hypothetical protein n=1 Tax=Bradyrhizobium elkanii TaxID=29448 RepID=UPI003513ED5A
MQPQLQSRREERTAKPASLPSSQKGFGKLAIVAGVVGILALGSAVLLPRIMTPAPLERGHMEFIDRADGLAALKADGFSEAALADIVRDIEANRVVISTFHLDGPMTRVAVQIDGYSRTHTATPQGAGTLVAVPIPVEGTVLRLTTEGQDVVARFRNGSQTVPVSAPNSTTEIPVFP